MRRSRKAAAAAPNTYGRDNIPDVARSAMANHNPRTAAGDKRAADTSDSADTITAPPKKLKFIPDDAVGEPLEKGKKSLMKYSTSEFTAMPFDSPDISAAQPMDQELDPNTAVGTPVEQKKKLSAAERLLARSAARESATQSNDSAELKTAQPRQQQLTPNPAQNTAMNGEVQRLSDKEKESNKEKVKRYWRNRERQAKMDVENLLKSNAEMAAENEAQGQQQALPALPHTWYSSANRRARSRGSLEPLEKHKTKLTGAFGKMGGRANADQSSWGALAAAKEPAYGAWQDDSASLEAFGGSLAGGPLDADAATDTQVASDADSNASARSEGSPASDDSAPPRAYGSSSNSQAVSDAAVVEEAVVEGTDGSREKLDLPSSTKSSRRSS